MDPILNQNMHSDSVFIFKRKGLFIILFCALLIICNGCGYQQPLNLTIAKERVERYYECGQYDKDLDVIISSAIRYFKKVSAHKNTTVIFDIDDTVLSDYANAKSISFGYVPKLSHEWVLQASAPAIPQTKRLYDYLVDRGFIIIFLTGRKHNEYDATIRNLKTQGFTNFDRLIVRQKDEEDLNAQDFKANHRRELTRKGYKIVGCVGDQWSDMKGGYTGRKVKLPNVRYFIP